MNQSDLYSSTKCDSVCGDSYLAVGIETCDDGNDVSGDGCDESCMAEEGWACTQEGCRKDVCQCEGYCADEQCTSCTKMCGTDNDCGEGFCDDTGACQVRTYIRTRPALVLSGIFTQTCAPALAGLHVG